MHITFIDIIGLPFDGDTLSHRGLGGSESAVILLAKQLASIGFQVTVYNNCGTTGTQEGIYSDVEYKNRDRLLTEKPTTDILISSRTVTPFLPLSLAQHANMSIHAFDSLRNSSKMKIMWMHDTFSWGDGILEQLAASGAIDRIFTLSDWHTSYVMNCQHGQRRNFEVLKNKIWVTRNGAECYIPWVDISAKDPNLFVYNSSVTKGMIPLVEKIWPQVRARIPNAKLVIIGGYYKFKDGDPADEQEQTYWRLRNNNDNANMGIEFTGIITQREIADRLAKASFMIYPGAFPETFGISMMESMMYGTPIIGTRFGATEETATQQFSYLLDYAIEPNSLFPDINHEEQVAKFVELVCSAHSTPYLTQQKQQGCLQVKNISLWRDIALEWKQHIFYTLKMPFPVEELQRVKWIQSQVHKIWGRRWSNPEEHREIKTKENPLVVISPGYNCSSYIRQHIHSVANQDYSNWQHYIIDDASTDDTARVARAAINELPLELQNKITLITNTTNQGAVANQWEYTQSLPTDCIVLLLDADDQLVSEPDVFDCINNEYNNGAEFTYGSCWSDADSIPLIAQEYPREVKQNKTYSQHQFVWGLPYTHLRTFRKRLIEQVEPSAWKDSSGAWFKAGGDVATFYSLIGQAQPDAVRCIKRILVRYNDLNPLNDYKINSAEQTSTAKEVKNKMSFNVDLPKPSRITARLLELSKQPLLPTLHIQKLKELKSQGFEPKVIYDIGACVLHWTKPAANTWPSAQIYAFEAMPESEELFKQANIPYYIGVVGKEDGVYVDFYQNNEHPSGNSYYIENPLVNHEAPEYFNQSHKRVYSTKTLDTIVKEKSWPAPDLVKIDCQGAEMDIIQGAEELIKQAQYVILELQSVEYNAGAPLKDTVIDYMASLGFDCEELFCNNGPDGDYLFKRQSNQFTVIVPTMWKYAGFLKQIDKYLSCDQVGQLVIINNHASAAPKEIITKLAADPKVTMHIPQSNIGVNPSWNWGVANARFNKICIANDDIEFDLEVFGAVCDHLDSSVGVIGMNSGLAEFNQEPITTNIPKVIAWNGQHTFGFGQLMFVLKDSWTPIPSKLVYYYGDQFVFETAQQQRKKIMMLTDFEFHTPHAQTTKTLDPSILEYETNIYKNLKNTQQQKKILIAIPTAKYIESITFKSIYDLTIPDGYTVDFQFFYGYRIDQIRNLIAKWAIGYDYLFSVDSDIELPKDSLVKMLAHDVDAVSGVYIQRKPNEEIVEIYRDNKVGGMSNIPWGELKGKGLTEVAACGFGCVLVKSQVFAAIGYPQFEYHVALDHNNTVSEDVDFCRKARDKGFRIWADPSIVCNHWGSNVFRPS
jgi:FkbM family methyltransferase